MSDRLTVDTEGVALISSGLRAHVGTLKGLTDRLKGVEDRIVAAGPAARPALGLVRGAHGQVTGVAGDLDSLGSDIEQRLKLLLETEAAGVVSVATGLFDGLKDVFGSPQGKPGPTEVLIPPDTGPQIVIDPVPEHGPLIEIIPLPEGGPRIIIDPVPEPGPLITIDPVPPKLPSLLTSSSYTPPPKTLPGFPDAKPVKPKTPVQGGGGLRKRWKDPQGNIYEWDSQHGRVEKYNKRGKHQGEYDPNSGKQTKPADPNRKVES